MSTRHALVGKPGEVVAQERETGVCAGGEQLCVSDLDGDLPVAGDEVTPWLVVVVVVDVHDRCDPALDVQNETSTEKECSNKTLTRTWMAHATFPRR